MSILFVGVGFSFHGALILLATLPLIRFRTHILVPSLFFWDVLVMKTTGEQLTIAIPPRPNVVCVRVGLSECMLGNVRSFTALFSPRDLSQYLWDISVCTLHACLLRATASRVTLKFTTADRNTPTQLLSESERSLAHTVSRKTSLTVTFHNSYKNAHLSDDPLNGIACTRIKPSKTG